MKKTRFVLSSIALGLSVLTTPFVTQAGLPSLYRILTPRTPP